MEIDQQKKILRNKIKDLKRELTDNQRRSKSDSIWSQLEGNLEFQKASNIMMFWSMKDEVDSHDFIQKWASKKQIILPVVNGDELLWKVFKGVNEMVDGDLFGIGEPIGEEIKDFNDINLIIVPGIAFDKRNNRMGRGKAYYDKTLKSLHMYKIGVCFDFQLVKSVPVDEYDIKMDEIITNQ